MSDPAILDFKVNETPYRTDPNRPSTRTSVSGIKCKLDLPVIINVNARSLNMEKVEELQVIVDYYDVSIACITETWFKDYMGSHWMVSV